MKRRLALLLVAVVCGAGSVTAPPAVGTATPLTAAKPCDAGYVHAALSWGHKCLRAGQFCRRSADREYHRYGFHCHRSGRLTR